MPKHKTPPEELESSSSDDEVGEDSLDPYEYHPLRAPKSIRLLILQPGSKETKEVVCELLEVDLNPRWTQGLKTLQAKLENAKAKEKGNGRGTCWR